MSMITQTIPIDMKQLKPEDLVINTIVSSKSKIDTDSAFCNPIACTPYGCRPEYCSPTRCGAPLFKIK